MDSASGIAITQQDTLAHARRATIDLDLIVRSLLFVAALLLVWISVHPFEDLSVAIDPAASASGDTANQVAYVVLGAAFAAFALSHGVQAMRPAISPGLVLTVAWLVVTVIASQHPALSARRLILVAIVTGMAALMPLLPRSLRHFSDMLAGCSVLVLAVCYLGIAAAPHLSIHQASDPMESLAGDWRGLFSHKNTAGAMMAVFVFVGLFVARTRSLLAGSAIVSAAAVFLAFTEAKTPILLLPVTLVAAPALIATPGALLRVMICLALIAVLNLVTIGGVFFPTIADLLKAILPDPTFTGRTYIWDFIRDHMAGHLWLGYGFFAFWGSPEVVYGPTEAPDFVPLLTSGHNSYLDLALMIGLPGLVIVLGWLVVSPLMGLPHSWRGRDERALMLLFVRIWLFGLTSTCFESVLLRRDDPLWFTMLIAVFGLRYLSRRRVIR